MPTTRRTWASLLAALFLLLSPGCVTCAVYELGIFSDDERPPASCAPGEPGYRDGDDDDDPPSLLLLPATLAIDLFTAPIQIWFWPLLFEDD